MVTLEELRKKHEAMFGEKSKGGGGGKTLDNYLDLKMGKKEVRILPGKNEPFDFFSKVDIHRYENEEGEVRSYYCRKMEVGEECPLCEFYFDLWKSHKALGLPPKTKSKYGDLATSIRGTPRFYMNVIDREILAQNPDDPAKAVKIFSTGQKVMKKITDGLYDTDLQDEKDPNNTTVLSLKLGNDFMIEKADVGGYNNYDGSKFRAKKGPAATPSQVAAIMESLHDIHGMIKISDYDEGKKIVDFLKVELSEQGNTPPSKSSVDDEDSEEKFSKTLKS